MNSCLKLFDLFTDCSFSCSCSSATATTATTTAAAPTARQQKLQQQPQQLVNSLITICNLRTFQDLLLAVTFHVSVITQVLTNDNIPYSTIFIHVPIYTGHSKITRGLQGRNLFAKYCPF